MILSKEECEHPAGKENRFLKFKHGLMRFAHFRIDAPGCLGIGVNGARDAPALLVEVGAGVLQEHLKWWRNRLARMGRASVSEASPSLASLSRFAVCRRGSRRARWNAGLRRRSQDPEVRQVKIAIILAARPLMGETVVGEDFQPPRGGAFESRFRRDRVGVSLRPAAPGEDRVIGLPAQSGAVRGNQTERFEGGPPNRTV